MSNLFRLFQFRKRIISNFNRLFQLEVENVAVASSFNATAANTLSITLGNPSSPRITINDNGVGDLSTTPNLIRFNQSNINGFAITGVLKASQGYTLETTGLSINGIVINLTSLRATNNNPNDASTTLVFECNFPLIQGLPGVFAYPSLDGKFVNSNKPVNQVNFDLVAGGNVIPRLSSIGRTAVTSPYNFEDFLRDNKGNPANISFNTVSNTIVTGTVGISLARGEVVELPTSASIVILNEAELEAHGVTLQDIHDNCDRHVEKSVTELYLARR